MSPEYTDARIVQLLQDVPLPDLPTDLYVGAAARRRRSDRRRMAVLGSALATVLVAGAVTVASLRTTGAPAVDSVLSGSETTAHVVGTGALGPDGTLRIEGDVDFTHHATSFEILLQKPDAPTGTTPPLRSRQIGEDKWTFQQGLDGGKDFWLHQKLGSHDDFSQLDPTTLFTRLRRSTLRRVGGADVDGVTTTHYTVSQQKGDAGSPFAEGAGEVFVDEQGLVRRLVLRQAEGSFTFTFSDFGKAVDIQPPPASEVKEESDAVGTGVLGGSDCTVTTTAPAPASQSARPDEGAYSSSCSIQLQPNVVTGSTVPAQSPEQKAMFCQGMQRELSAHPERKEQFTALAKQFGCPAR